MPRRNKNARHIKLKGKKVRIRPMAKLIWVKDDGIRLGKIVAAAEWKTR